LGNIIDPLHSTLWLEKNPGEPGCVCPWTDFRASEYAFKFSDSIRAILKNNFEIWSGSFPDQSSPLPLS
jgi:hypothetical protein